VIYFWIQFMSKFYESLMLAVAVVGIGNSAEATMTNQALGIPRSDARAKPSQGILGVEFGSQTSAASITTAPVAVSLKLADDCSDEIKVSHSEESRAHLQDGEIAGIATTGGGITRQTRTDGSFTMHNDGPGIGTVAQEHSRAWATQSPVEFINVINDMHPPLMASVKRSLMPAVGGMQAPPRAEDASLHGAIVLDGEQAPGEPGCTSCKCPPCRYNPWELAGHCTVAAYAWVATAIWIYKLYKKNFLCKRDVVNQEPNVQ
jgi:hypothetical protein